MKILLIGSRGRMAKLFLKLGREQGLAIAGLDLPYTDETLRAAALGVSLCLFCVPALVFEEVLGRVCPYLPRDCVVADITSVKELPLQAMERHWEGAVVGTHPLFGPKPDFSEALPVAITPSSHSTEASLALTEDFFQSLGFQVFRCSAKDHDLAEAKIQNLNFITSLAYFALLSGQEELLPFLTPSFRRRLNSAQKMLTEDAPMFQGLFEANPHSHEAVRQYSKILSLAASGDLDILAKRAMWWWKDSDLKKT